MAERAESRITSRSKGFNARVWVKRHLQAAIYALGQLSKQPLNTLLTSAVIGIALALPASLFALLENVEAATQGWQGSAQLSLYLQPALAAQRRGDLLADLERRAEIRSAHLISAEEALEEYRRMTGFEDLDETLGGENPLPAVIVLDLKAETPAETVGALIDELGRHPDVELVQSDLKWLERLRAIVALLERGLGVIAALFGIGVLLIVGNTIRLGVQSRHEEIEISRLIGATDAFIRRPFLYSGAWYGLLGAVIAWLLVAACFALLAGPVRELAELYHSEFRLGGPGAGALGVLLAAGAVLGLTGSWVSLGVQLRQPEFA